jgi:signal transduction histidine kinase
MPKINLFTKIYLGFWLTTVFIFLATVTLDRITEPDTIISQGHPFPGRELLLYGQTAQDLFEREGATALNQFLSRLEMSTGFQGFLFDEKGIEMSHRNGPPGMEALVAEVAKNNKTELIFSRKTHMAVLKLHRSDGRNHFIGVKLPGFPPPQGMLKEKFFSLLMRLSVALILSGFVCYLLARYFTRPIVRLGNATRQLAAGDFSVRVSSKLGKRKDEISRLAFDFDLMAERIESLMVSQRNLLRDISHELRSPLARLNVALELSRQHSGPEAKKSLDRIEQESEKLNELIEELLTLNRFESKMVGQEKRDVEMSILLWEVAADADFEARSMNRGVQVIAASACCVAGNPELLRRAIENVVRNGVRYTKEGSTVEISLRIIKKDNDPYALITVRDHGTGVPEEALSLLFKPFYRVGEGRDRLSGGVGLGLSITEAAVRFHGGTVKALNAPDGGLIIDIQLPVTTGPGRDNGPVTSC